MAYKIPWQQRGEGHKVPPPMEMTPEYPKLMKMGTQELNGMPRRFPK